MEGNFRWGSYLPALQIGDTVRAGMAVAQIPDLKNWEATARIGELDRGHLAVGQNDGHRCRRASRKNVRGHNQEHRRHDRTALGSLLRKQDSPIEKPVAGAAAGHEHAAGDHARDTLKSRSLAAVAGAV